MELPDNVVASTDEGPDEGLYSADWYPEDATVEVSSSSTAERSLTIISSLRENFIRSRETSSPDGSKKIFVLPEDELRAREIVREIEERRPTE